MGWLLGVKTLYCSYGIMKAALILFLIVFLEGYVVLSTELLAIRLMIPFTGSGTDTVSIIIAAVLMPLAFGYYAGGQFRTRGGGAYRSTVRKKLVTNLLISAAILSFGLSHVFLQWGLDTFLYFSPLKNRIALTALYALLFLVYPVFLLGQTVPLVSNYFPRKKLQVMAGKILFFSTLGSFMGAIFCTLVLMTWLGVHYAAVVTIGCLCLLVFLIARGSAGKERLAALACLLAALVLNSGFMMERQNIVANNRNSLIQVSDAGNLRSLYINRNLSSDIDLQTGKSAFGYIQYMEKAFIDPLIWRSREPVDILVIGAGGFTMGLADDHNNYVFIDIDETLQDVAEKHFLDRKLPPNKKFEAVEARAYLRNPGRKFDLILMDVFHGPSKTPEHLATREFFQDVKNALKPGGIMAGNYVVSANFSDDFSIVLDNTMRDVFGNLNRIPLTAYDGWDRKRDWQNVIYTYYNTPEAPRTIYTDDKNGSMFDKPLNY